MAYITDSDRRLEAGILKYFLNKYCCILFQIIAIGPMNNMAILVWRETGIQTLYEPLLAYFSYAHMRGLALTS